MKKYLNNLIREVFSNNQNYDINWELSALDDFDYSTTFALKNSKLLNKAPKNIAIMLQNEFEKNPNITKISITGPGFVNIVLSDNILPRFLNKIREIKNTKSETVVIDFSSPNIAKKMHIGHLRSTVIGHSLVLINKHFKQKVISDSHIGDWGTQFGKLITAFNLWLDKSKYEKDPLEELQRIYVKFHIESKKNPELIVTARKNLSLIQKKDPKIYSIWQEFTKISLSNYDKIYKKLGITFDYQIGESFYNDMMPMVVNKLLKKGIASKDKGAVVVFFDEAENIPPAIIQKSDKSFLYLTSELATILYRLKTFKNDKSLYVVDLRQKNHFQQTFSIAKKLGIKQKLEFVSFGLMKFSNNIKISTREGTIINLEKLLDDGFKKSYEILSTRNPEMSLEEKKKIANTIAVGAIKYFDFMHQRNSEIIFSWEKALNFQGNSALYIQYTYARISSLLKKSNHQVNFNNIKYSSKIERKIIVQLYEYNTTITKAWKNCEPHYIASFLFKIASTFNTWYNSVKFLDEKIDKIKFNSQLYLASCVREVIFEGLDLLGIVVLDKI